jgi:hypothetical protein
MIPTLLINDISQTYSCWFVARRSQARIYLLNLANNCTAITSINLLRARSDRPPYPIDSAKISLHPSDSHLVSTTDVPKSP